MEDDSSEDGTLQQPAGVPIGASVEDVLEMLQTTATRINDLLPPMVGTGAVPAAEDIGAVPAAEDTGAVPAAEDTGAVPAAEDEVEAAAGAEELDEPHVVHRVDPGITLGSAACRNDAQSVRPPHLKLSRAGDVGKTACRPGSGAGQSGALRAGSGVEGFQPMLQVDQFAWPAVCCRLGEVAADELDRLADGLVEVMARGETIVAIGGCRRGEGATTLLLCAGRRLAERGLRVIMADANLADPRVASRLGLLPQAGWEDVLAGRLPLEEAVIESTGDRLAVLPVCRSSHDAGETDEDGTRLAESLRTLATHYDLVLLDPGPLEELGAAGASLARGIGERLEAIALVHNGHITPSEDLDEVRRSLAEAEIVQVGVVENFVRD